MSGIRTRLRAKGLPIGSGHVEATCKTLVSTRMKRSGASWKTPGGQAVLSLRSLARSSRWSAAMEFLLATYIKPVCEVEGGCGSAIDLGGGSRKGRKGAIRIGLGC